MVAILIPRRFCIVAILLLAFLRTQGLGTTVSTPASRVVSAVAHALDDLQKQQGKKEVVNVSDLYPFLNMEKMNDEAHGSLESRIVLFGTKGPVHEAKQILAVTSNQIAEDRQAGLGRYVVWAKGNAIDVSWESEETMVGIFAQSKTLLPNKGVWQQPDTRAIYDFGLKPPPGNPPAPSTRPDTGMPDAQSVNPPQAKQSNVPKLATPTTAVPQSESKSWLLWLGVVIAATGGAAWLFLRKSRR